MEENCKPSPFLAKAEVIKNIYIFLKEVIKG